MKTIKISLALVLAPLYAENELLMIPAVCVVSVSDLVTDKPTPSGKKTVEECYRSLPITNTPLLACSRITQLLYNEQVTILEQDGEQVYVETEWWYFRPGASGQADTKVNRFWMLADHLRMIKDLPSHYRHVLPGVLNGVPAGHVNEVIGLALPWKCEATGQLFSVGTRFVVQAITPNSYQVLLYNPKTQQAHPYSIPKEYCVVEDGQRSSDEQRTLFVSLVKRWAHSKTPIQYVLGGASYLGSNDASFPYSGLDCSGMIRRAARLAGISITATNSYSMLSQCNRLSPDELPQPGDLLYWRGHIMVITNTHKHLLAEARGYTNGHGIIHEIPYKKELEGIRTTKELARAVKDKKIVKRLDPYGKPYQELRELVLLRLPSY